MHEPTPPARRVAALRYQAEQLMRDAAAWGFELEILAPGRRTGNEQAVNLRPILCESSGECRMPGNPRCTADSCGLDHDNESPARPPASSPAAPER